MLRLKAQQRDGQRLVPCSSLPLAQGFVEVVCSWTSEADGLRFMSAGRTH